VRLSLCVSLLAALALACGEGQEPGTQNATPANLSKNPSLAEIEEQLAVEDCATPPATQFSPIDNVEEIESAVGWTPLKAGADYEAGSYGWRYAWTCSGAQAVLVFYQAPGSGLSIGLQQGLRSDDLPRGNLQPAVTIGAHEVSFLEADQSMAVFELDTDDNGSTLYAVVDGANRSEVEAFVETLTR
jgi:hypothetical protein